MTGWRYPIIVSGSDFFTGSSRFLCPVGSDPLALLQGCPVGAFVLQEVEGKEAEGEGKEAGTEEGLYVYWVPKQPLSPVGCFVCYSSRASSAVSVCWCVLAHVC